MSSNYEIAYQSTLIPIMIDPLLFISYRTSDTRSAASNLARALKREFDPELVFIDYMGIEGGEKWTDRLALKLDRATVLFVMIGKHWINTVEDATGHRRLNLENDWVRIEIESCIRTGKTIVPILVDDAPPLREEDLPPSLHPLVHLQHWTLYTTVSFYSDVKRLVNLMQAKGFKRSAHPWFVSPDSVYQRVELDRFVGREWLTESVDEFLHTHSRGYFVLEAKSGLGKTAFLAHLVETRGYLHHFVELLPGNAGVVPGLRNLAAQIIAAFGLETTWVDDLLNGLDTRSDFLQRMLVAAASRKRVDDGPVVIVVDGLDQAGALPKQNVLGLPRELPEGFYFIVSKRPVETRLTIDTPRKVVSIKATADSNLRDVKKYVRDMLPNDAAVGPELVQRSQGNWMYLYHVCREIREGYRDLDDMDGLPHGLWQYYARFFQAWRLEHEQRWNTSDLSVLSTLSAAQESLDLKSVSEFAGVEEEHAYRLMMTDWRPFVTVTAEITGDFFQLYHASLGDFVGGHTELEGLDSAETSFANELSKATCSRHAIIASQYLDRWGGILLEGLRKTDGVEYRKDYGWRNIVKHLAESGDWELVERLLRTEWTFSKGIPIPYVGWKVILPQWARRRQELTYLSVDRNAWFESHAQAGDLALFLDDWRHTTEVLRTEGSGTNPETLTFEILSYFVESSVRKATQRVPIGLVVSLVRCGHWTIDQCIAFSHEVADVKTRATVLTEIVSIKGAARPSVLKEAKEAIDALEEPNKRFEAVVKLLNACPEAERDSLLVKAISILPDLTYDQFVELSPSLVLFLSPKLWRKYLSQVETLRIPVLKLRALAASASLLPDPSPILEPLEMARRECMENADKLEYSERSLIHAIVASLSDGEEAIQLADSALDSAFRAIASPKDLDEQPYEAIATIALAFPDRVSGEFLASSIGHLLPKRYWKGHNKERQFLALIGSITTTEQIQSKLAALLISVTPHRELSRVKKAVFKTRPDFNDWDAYQQLALRYAQIGEGRKALKVIKRIKLRSARHKALASIAPHLDEECVDRALELTDEIRAKLLRCTRYSDVRYYDDEQAEDVIDAMVGLLPQLAKFGRDKATIARVHQLYPERYSQEWLSVMTETARHASTGLLNELLRTSMGLHDLEQGLVAVVELAAFLPVDAVRGLIMEVRGIGYSRNKNERVSFGYWNRSTSGMEDVDLRKRALHTLACRLTELGCPEVALKELSIFIQYTNQERNDQGVADCLAEIAPHLSLELIGSALNLVVLHSPQHLSYALETLAPSLTAEWFPIALKIARMNPELQYQAWAIGALVLAPDQDQEQRKILALESWGLLKACFEEGANATFGEAPRILGLIGAYHPDALEKLRGVVSEGKESSLPGLIHLLRCRDTHLVDEMITLASQHYDDSTMLGLAEFLPESEFLSYLDRVLTNGQADLRISDEVFRSICQRLGDLGETIRAYSLALRISNPLLRTRTAMSLSGSLAELPHDELWSLWVVTSRILQDSTRTGAFKFVGAIAPLVHALGGVDEIQKLQNAIKEVTRWWV